MPKPPKSAKRREAKDRALPVRTRVRELMARRRAISIEPDHPLLVSRANAELSHGWKTTGKIVLYKPKLRGKMTFVNNVEKRNFDKPGEMVHKTYTAPLETGKHPQPWIKHGIVNPVTGERAEVMYVPKEGGTYEMAINDVRSGNVPKSLRGESMDVQKARDVLVAHGELMGGKLGGEGIYPRYESVAGQVNWGQGALRIRREPRGMALVPVKNKKGRQI
jgi:hypothetical protein